MSEEPITVRPAKPRPDGMHGCVLLPMIAVSQLVAGGSLCFVVVMAWVMQSRLDTILEEKAAGLVMVPVVDRTLGVGTVIGATDIVVREVERSFVHPKAILDPADLVGRTLRERVLVGEFFREERLAPLTPNQGLNAIVPEGVRAVQVDLREGDRVSGWIEPGNGVDLLVTLPGDTTGLTETVTIAQAVRILAIDEKISETARGDKIRTPQVTLAIPLASVEGVIHAMSIGQGKLALRSEIDLHHQKTNGVVRIGELGNGLTTAEFRARYTEDDVARWVSMVHGDREVREPIVDPELLRGIGGDAESNVHASIPQ